MRFNILDDKARQVGLAISAIRALWLLLDLPSLQYLFIILILPHSSLRMSKLYMVSYGVNFNISYRSYSYYIEVSMDEKDWVRIVDHTRYLCRSWQYMRFPERVVKYVRVVGTHNTVNRVFHLVCLEAMYTKRPVTLESGVIGRVISLLSLWISLVKTSWRLAALLLVSVKNSPPSNSLFKMWSCPVFIVEIRLYQEQNLTHSLFIHDMSFSQNGIFCC